MNASLFDLFQRGGPVMWPILIASITALAIVLERLFAFGHAEEELPALLPAVTAAVRSGQMAQAQALCEQAGGPAAKMIQVGLGQAGRPRQEILSRMEEAGALELPALERRLPLLGTIAHQAPLLGLLGTVTGLVRCFQVIQEKATTANPVNPADLAGGIWEALLTTVFGLLLAIPAYGMYHYLVHRLNGFSHSLQTAAVELADVLSEGEQPGWVSSGQRKNGGQVAHAPQVE